MNIFFSLIKNNIINYYTSSSLITKRKKLSIILYTLVFAYIFAVTFLLSYFIGESLPKTYLKLLPLLGIFTSFTIVFGNSILSGSSYLFNTRDDDFLCSLPIKHSTVFLSKLISFYLLNLVYTFFTYIPFIISYFIFSHSPFLSIIYGIIGFIILPSIPLILGTLINLLLNLFTSTLKFKKVIQIIFIFLILFVSLYFSSNISQLNVLLSNIETTYSSITTIYYPSIFLIQAIINHSFLNILYFILISLIPIIIFIIICSKNYIKINSRLQKTTNNKKMKDLKYKKGNIYSALLKKEVKKVFSSVSYFTNSCMGPILLLILSIALVFGFQYIIVGNATNTEIISIISLIIFCLSLNGPLTVTFSLEGSSFWIYKSSPISPKQILDIKLLTQILLFLPLTLISITILLIYFKFNFLLSLALIIFSIVICVFCSIIHLIIGMKKYNLHYTHEIQIIKQSSNVLFSTLFGFLLSTIIILLYNFVLKFCPLIWFIFSLIIIFTILTIVLYFTKIKLSMDKFLEIE